MCRGSKRWVERLSVVGWNGEMGWREAGCFDGGKWRENWRVEQ